VRLDCLYFERKSLRAFVTLSAVALMPTAADAIDKGSIAFGRVLWTWCTQYQIIMVHTVDLWEQVFEIKEVFCRCHLRMPKAQGLAKPTSSMLA
jgi:hypothetical protein